MRAYLSRYPRPFWVLLVFLFLNRTGSALIWPFMTLLMRQRLNAPLITITSLISLQAVTGLIGMVAAGWLMDRYGRKPFMLFSLFVMAGIYMGMFRADQLWQWMILVMLNGVFNAVFYSGVNAMTTDLIPPTDRAGAFALVRTLANLAIAIGPALAGVFLGANYGAAYPIAAGLYVLMAFPFLWIIKESMPVRGGHTHTQAPTRKGGGYGYMLRDKAFMAFCGAYLMVELAVAMVFILLPIYVKENYGIPENQYSLLLTVNAGMVALLQVVISRWSSRYRPFAMLTLGGLLYVVGLSGFALSSLLPHFVISMAILTVGELIVAPTSNSVVAALAPMDMRARYLSIFSLAWTMGSGIGPIAGGFLSDTFAPQAIWIGAAVFAGCSALGFALLGRRQAQSSDAKGKAAPAG
jgi:MFS family permease